MKTCTKCGEAKPLLDYHMRKERGYPYEQCKACMYARARVWRKKNPHKDAEYMAIWTGKDPEHTRAIYREMKARQRARPERKFAMRFSTSVCNALVGVRKHAPTFSFLGYTLSELRAHIERQFTRGMTWKNYGQWHVDHIVPLSAFNFETSRDPAFVEAWALTNLRPLWAKENLRKHANRTHLV